MRTATFKSVYQRVMRAVGLDPSTTGITADQKAHIVDLINARVREGWCYDFWPELITTESRAYRETWDATQTYVDGDEVYYAGDGKYYEALRTTINDVPSTSTSDWAEITGLDPYYPYEPADAAAIGDMIGIFSKDPRENGDDVKSLAFSVQADGIWVHDDLRGTATNWIRFRARPPEFTLVEWNSGTTYSEGDVVYVDATGECYQAAYDDTGAEVWVKLDMPWVLADFIVRGAAADYLREQGNEDRAEREEAGAREALEREHTRVFAQQGPALARMAIRIE